MSHHKVYGLQFCTDNSGFHVIYLCRWVWIYSSILYSALKCSQQRHPAFGSLQPKFFPHCRWMVQHPTTPHNKTFHQASAAGAAKINPASHVTPAHSRQPAWRQGTFQPPWTSMRRRPGIASALPSDWGWAALGPCNDKVNCISLNCWQKPWDALPVSWLNKHIAVCCV